jgi:hypothetical protein
MQSLELGLMVGAGILLSLSGAALLPSNRNSGSRRPASNGARSAPHPATHLSARMGSRASHDAGSGGGVSTGAQTRYVMWLMDHVASPSNIQERAEAMQDRRAARRHADRRADPQR